MADPTYRGWAWLVGVATLPTDGYETRRCHGTPACTSWLDTIPGEEQVRRRSGPRCIDPGTEEQLYFVDGKIGMRPKAEIRAGGMIAFICQRLAAGDPEAHDHH